MSNTYEFTPELTPEFIFNNINQKDIIDFIYGYDVPLNDNVLNLFRTDEEDNNPGAWFEFYKGRLVLVDFADPATNRLDVIGLVGIYAKLSYTESLSFIYNKFIMGKDLVLEKKLVYTGTTTTKSNPLSISYVVGPFMDRDKEFWAKREITKQQLLTDKVFRCVFFEFYSNRLRKTISVKIKPKELCYVFTHYKSGAIKIYRPEASNKKFKFSANTTQNDIGLIDSIDFSVPYIVLTKGYKEARELINLSYNSIYLMNEGVYPSKEAFWFLPKFKTIYLIMDNDYTGRVYAVKLKAYILTLFDLNVVILNCEFWNDLDAFLINDKVNLINYLSNNINKIE